MSAESTELTALRATAANLTASIAARRKVANPTGDFQLVTAGEETRLAAVEAEIALLTTAAQSPQSSASSSSTSSQSV